MTQRSYEPPEPTLNENDVEAIAKFAHNANRVYCAAIGELAKSRWSEMSPEHKASFRAGVTAILLGEARTPVEQHELWLKRKTSEGWIWGPQEDAATKQHPCLLPYTELPIILRAKDSLFRCVVVNAAELLGLKVVGSP